MEILSVSGCKFDIFGGDSICLCEKNKFLYKKKFNSEWLLRQSCLNPQLKTL